MPRTETRVTGLGGQGVILLAYVLGKAAALYGDRQAVMTQSFGPEARGSACSAQVVVADERIACPTVSNVNFLIALSQEGYDKFVGGCAKDATVFIEEELVKSLRPSVKHMAVPATRLAEKVGRRVVLNMVMLGFFARHSGLLTQEAFENAIKASVPRGTEDLNLAAFRSGWEAQG